MHTDKENSQGAATNTCTRHTRRTGGRGCARMQEVKQIMGKIYAVKRGRQTGIFETWAECLEQVHGYGGAVFKGFTDRAAAESFLTADQEEEPIKKGLPYAYIDGSYSKTRACYAWGGFIDNHGAITILQGSNNAAGYMEYRNVTGEIRGALEVIRQCLKMGIPEINLYYDYSGVEQWAAGNWKCKNELSKFYYSYYRKYKDRLTVHFIHVDGHTGIEGNEIADYLAREAAGGKLTKKEAGTLREFRNKAAEKEGA